MEQENEEEEKRADREAQSFRKEWKPAPANAPRPDGFVPKRRNLPRDHNLATDHSEELLLDAVRTLLDLHYEARARDAALERMRKKAADRGRAGEDTEEEEEAEDKDAKQLRRRNKQARSRACRHRWISSRRGMRFSHP